MEVDVRVEAQPAVVLGLVGREVVEDHVDLDALDAFDARKWVASLLSVLAILRRRLCPRTRAGRVWIGNRGRVACLGPGFPGGR